MPILFVSVNECVCVCAIVNMCVHNYARVCESVVHLTIVKCVSARRWKRNLSCRVNFRGSSWNMNGELSGTGSGLVFFVAKSVETLLLQKG